MNARANTTIECRLDDGREITLTPDDCACIINAMARRHLLAVMVEEIPADMADVLTHNVCAWTTGCDEHDEEVVLNITASDYTSATPRQKTRKRSSR